MSISVYGDLATTGATADGQAAFEQASHEFRCYIGDPVASVERALLASPAMTMAHVLKAWLHLLGTEPGQLHVASDCLRLAEVLPANDRERGHLQAIRLLLAAAMDLVDASALLWRLHLRGIDLGERWDTVADRWSPLAGAGNYAFNDWHAMLAFVGSGRERAQQAVIESLQVAAASDTSDTGAFAREVGLEAAHAIHAFGQARYADTVAHLRPLRGHAHRFGGSHAQRDLLDLTLLEAAIRSDQHALASALAIERAALRPESPLNRLFLIRTANARRRPTAATQPDFQPSPRTPHHGATP